jgi:hypothetical protein
MHQLVGNGKKRLFFRDQFFLHLTFFQKYRFFSTVAADTFSL